MTYMCSLGIASFPGPIRKLETLFDFSYGAWERGYSRDGWWPLEWLKHLTANRKVAGSNPTIAIGNFLPLLGVTQLYLTNEVGVFLKAFQLK